MNTYYISALVCSYPSIGESITQAINQGAELVQVFEKETTYADMICREALFKFVAEEYPDKLPSTDLVVWKHYCMHDYNDKQ